MEKQEDNEDFIKAGNTQGLDKINQELKDVVGFKSTSDSSNHC